MPMIRSDDALDILDADMDVVDELVGGPSKDLVCLRERAAAEIRRLRKRLHDAEMIIHRRQHLTK